MAVNFKNLDGTGTVDCDGLLIGGTAIAGVANAVIGVASGYKIARGVTAITAASQDIVTGLATVVAATVSLNAAPTLTHMFSEVTIGDQAGAPAAGSIRVLSQKPTAAADVTPIAATTPFGTVNWVAVGT